MVPLPNRGCPQGDKYKQFCLQRGVPYNEFDKWFRKTHRTVVPVEVTVIPNVDNQQDGSGKNLALSTESKLPSPSKGGILVTIKTRDGLQVK